MESELALRQVPKYTGRTDGSYVESPKVGRWLAPGFLPDHRRPIKPRFSRFVSAEHIDQHNRKDDPERGPV